MSQNNRRRSRRNRRNRRNRSNNNKRGGGLRTRRVYRKRVKHSHCKGVKRRTCRGKAGCKTTRHTRKRRSYCRKSKNSTVRK